MDAFLAIPGQHVDPEGGCGTRRVLQHRTDLGLVSIPGKSMTTQLQFEHTTKLQPPELLPGVFHGEYVDCIGGHFLLGNEDFL